mgnify:CR=1 FL=1
MSAVLQQRNSEQEFLSSQQLPPDKRGISFGSSCKSASSVNTMRPRARPSVSADPNSGNERSRSKAVIRSGRASTALRPRCRR